MDHVICPERSPYAPSKVKPILSLTDSENENFESSFESSDPELIYEELLTSEQAQTLWEPESLMRLGLVCSSVSEDIEFDRLNNKLLIALKEFTTLNKVFCFKCKAMSLMTKRGKTNKTYQFACGSHTLSATQILGSLPDAFLLAHLPKEPRHIFNETLSWIGKDQLSPELNERSAKRNAVKRYSAHRSPMKGPTSSLLTSRNSVNEVLVELRELKSRVNIQEQTMETLKTANGKLSALNAGLAEQVKLLKEENLILKNYLNEPRSPSKLYPVEGQKTAQNSSYARISDIVKPPNKTMKFYTTAAARAPSTPIQVVSAPTAPIPTYASKAEFSPLKLVFFKGCHRKSIGEYKKMLPTIGFEPHWARHICFLAVEIVQFTTIESKVELLTKAMESISNEVKHVPAFNPLSGSSYSDYGNFTDEAASKSYISLMKQCATKLASEAQRIPSLRRTAAFLSKVVESKDINIKAAARPTRIFCLGDFIVKREPEPMDIDLPASTAEIPGAIPESSLPEAMIVDKTDAVIIPVLTEADLDSLLKDPTLSPNAQ